jgi:hypothetical protein
MPGRGWTGSNSTASAIGYQLGATLAPAGIGLNGSFNESDTFTDTEGSSVTTSPTAGMDEAVCHGLLFADASRCVTGRNDCSAVCAP